jgi:hypothetical protein
LILRITAPPSRQHIDDAPDANEHDRSGAVMGRRIPFTTAQVCRAVKAAEMAGLKVKKITIAPDGAITIDSEDSQSAVKKKSEPLASWDEAS